MKNAARGWNVLFIISDQHRRDASGCYGSAVVRTPGIDGLAGGGVTFSRAYTPSPLCGPARSAVMTGTHVHTSGGFTHQQDEPLNDIPTLGSVFRDAGYATAAIGKVHIRGESETRDLGFDERALRYYTYDMRDYIEAIGQENVEKYCGRRNGYNPDNAPIELEDELMFDHLVTERVIDFIERNRDDRFFAWVGLEKPHPQLYAPARFHEMYNPDEMELPETAHDPVGEIPETAQRRKWGRAADHMTDREMRGTIAAYFANTTYMDTFVSRLLDKLEELGIRERTIVVYTSDHGEMLFEHGNLQKHCFYEAAVAVPLIVSAPGVIPAGVRCGSLASLIDLFPSLLDLTGIPHPQTLEGESLLDVIEGKEERKDQAVFSEFYARGTPERMIRTHEWKYVHSHDDIAQFYDVAADPLERRNLASDPAHADVRKEFDARVKEGWEFPPSDIKMKLRPGQPRRTW